MTERKPKITAERDALVALRRELHRHPEVGLQEFRTAQVIERELDRLGVEHRRIGETGVLGILRGSGAGRRIVALRADIDALPIQEQNAVDYRSETDGVMHACGHDAHTACLLGAAKILAENRDAFGGEVRLCFQQAEEIGQGARQFLQAGVLDGVERVFGLHTAPDLPAGSVGIKPGANNASVDYFKITVQGKSAHVSTPQLGVDALYIASQIVVSLQALVTRLTSPIEPVLIGVGTLHAGTAYNALAASATLEGTVRAFSPEQRQQTCRQIAAVAEQTARLYGGSAGIDFADFTSPLLNDPTVCREATAVADRLWGPGHVIADRTLSLGGDDFAEFLLRVPGAYAYLGTRNDALPATQHPAHNGCFDIDEAVLPRGAELYAAYALWWLGQDELTENFS